MSERSEERELTALESALREMRPKPDTIDREMLMYRAGRASGHSWLWPITSVAATSLATVLGVLLLIRSDPPIIERIVYVPVPPVPRELPPAKPEDSIPPPPLEPLVMEPLESSPRGEYLRMQERVLRLGLKGIPPPTPAPPLPETPTVEQLLQSL
jgi:hypothetical protein